MVSQAEDLVLAADIGGTYMRAALVDHRGKVLVHRTVPTPPHDDAPAALIDLIRIVKGMGGQRAACHAVVGLPGAVDYDAGRLLWAPHLPETWPKLLSSDELASGLGLPVHVANDADLAAVGEATFGAGVGTADVAYLTISTGIGAGIICGGRLLRGRCSLAEVGHTVIDWHAWCAGQPSTLEELGSGSGMARQAAAAGLGDLDARAVVEAASLGDRRARQIWNGAVEACAIGVCNLLMTFSPRIVVVGGGIGRQEHFFAAVRAEVVSRPARHPSDATIVVSSLGDDAGLAGAAGWLAATSCKR
jgi:glucokinase